MILMQYVIVDNEILVLIVGVIWLLYGLLSNMTFKGVAWSSDVMQIVKRAGY